MRGERLQVSRSRSLVRYKAEGGPLAPTSHLNTSHTIIAGDVATSRWSQYNRQHCTICGEALSSVFAAAYVLACLVAVAASLQQDTVASVPGLAGRDYPALAAVPRTRFTCRGQVETRVLCNCAT